MYFIHTFDRGAIVSVRLECVDGLALGQANSVTVSPDGRNVFSTEILQRER
jgi:hypothetical protein